MMQVIRTKAKAEIARLGTCSLDIKAIAELKRLPLVQIGDKFFRNPVEIESIVHPLRHTVYFSPSHGGWAAETTLTIVSKSGQSHPLRVARYLRQSGAVLIFFTEAVMGPGSRDMASRQTFQLH